MKVVIIVPTYNERESVGALVDRVSQVQSTSRALGMHVLFVDDGSPDGTSSEVERMASSHGHIHLLERPEKKGIGSAYLDGFKEAIEQVDASIFVQMDADLQHPPEKIGELVEALASADVALGSRYVPGGGIEGLSGRRVLVSKVANWLARTILGLRVRDATSGFKALNRRAVEFLLGANLSASGFIYQVESIHFLQRAGFRIREVPFVFKQRLSGQSKLSAKEIIQFLIRIIVLRIKA